MFEAKFGDNPLFYALQAYDLLEMGLNDTEDSVVMDTKSYLLPVMGFWASTISNLQSHLLMNFLQKTVEAIQVGQKFTF